MSQINPFPPTGGEKIRSFGLLRGLAGLGHDIWAVTPWGNSGRAIPSAIPGVSFIQFDFATPKSLPRQFTGYFRKDPELVNLLDSIILQHEIDLAFIDYFFLGQYIRVFKDRGIPVIYGTHNAQSRLRLQQPARTWKEKMIRAFAYLAQAGHERAFFRKADIIVAVSEQDMGYYKRFLPAKKLWLIPNFIDESWYTPSGEKEPYIVMTGNFHSFQNYFGLEWFIKNVWRDELREMTWFWIVGRGAGQALKKITGKNSGDNIVVKEDVEDIREYIGRAAAAIVPLWHGSGTRLKCLEAMALKTQVISTNTGAEGIDHQGSIRIADTPEKFREFIKKSLKGELDCTDEANEIFLKKYSLKANMEYLGRLIDTLAP